MTANSRPVPDVVSTPEIVISMSNAINKNAEPSIHESLKNAALCLESLVTQVAETSDGVDQQLEKAMEARETLKNKIHELKKRAVRDKLKIYALHAQAARAKEIRVLESRELCRLQLRCIESLNKLQCQDSEIRGLNIMAAFTGSFR